jgi:MYXO-CTERM domain-containing protein
VLRLVFSALCVFASPALAHFILETPAASFEQNLLGDPQKAPPCGEVSGSTPTGVVTTYVAGQTITIRLSETIFHPGHYRVALGLTGPQDLPAEPVVTADAMSACGSAPIEANPQFPVLADGLLVHTTALSGKQTVQVTLPADKTCTNCTLQVLEFMSNHALNNPGGCYYHHCATINVVAPDGGTPPEDGTTNLAGTKGCGCSAGEASLSVAFGSLLLLATRRRKPHVARP